MTYQPHPSTMPEGSRREPSQQLPRAPPSSSSYDHRLAAMPVCDNDTANSWTSHHSFSPPKLPQPRNVNTNTAPHPYREVPLHWNARGDAPGPSAREGRFSEHAHQYISHAEAGRFVAEPSSRSRPSHFSDEPMGHYPPPAPPSVYARPSDAFTTRMRNDAYEREAGRHTEVQSRPSELDRPRPDSRSQRPISGSFTPSQHGFAPSVSGYSEYENQHAQPRHFHELHDSRRPSMQSVVPEPVDAVRYRPDPSTPSWSTSRPPHPTKRPIPLDVDADSDSRSPALLPRPYTASAQQYRQASPAASKSQPPLPPPAAPSRALPDQHLQDREVAFQPATPRLPRTSDSMAPSHALAAASAAAASPATPQPSLQPQRKRLRISRACDECRRRKTRCDIVGAFPGEPGHPLTLSGAVPPLEPNMEPKGEMLILQPCMNCRRSEVTCSYSKRPLKRGPSKGYIKDLERRLNSLESQIVSGERADGEAQEHADDESATPASASASASTSTASNAQPAKPKIRTEDRISRLESVLSRPSNVKSEDDKSVSADSSRRNSDSDAAHVKPEAAGDTESEMSAPTSVADTVNKEADVEMAQPTTSAADGQAGGAVESVSSSATTEVAASPASSRPEAKTAVSKGKGKAIRRSAASSPSRVPDTDVAEVKSKVVTSFLHATFPVVPTRPEAESSNSNIARLEDRVLARGLKLLTEPAEMVLAAQDPPKGAPSSKGSKAQAHASRVASLIGQASAGLGGARDELALLHARPGTDALRALRKVSHRLSGQEADLLMLCHLDQLRNGRSNNSALAAAVSKLGSGSHVQNDRETYRRRTLLFMLDRWHAVAFGTPHLLMGRFGMERHSFRSMKEALGDVSQSPLGDAVYEVLRCAIMLGQLNDLVQNNGGWKGISKSDVEAVIHSATDVDERTTALDAQPEGVDPAPSTSGGSQSETGPGLLSTEALRYSLESLVRCYYALHTLPNAKDARVEDLHRIFTLAESILVLGTGKTPISLQGKLVQSAIGPHVLAVAGLAFSWCLRIVCMMVAQSLSSDPTPSTSTSATASSTTPAVKGESTTVSISPTSFPLEFYRRKILDYVRMCGPFCLFSGGPPTCTGSFAPVYLRLALYFNSTVSFASQLGSLVSPQSEKASPIHQDAIALGNDADNMLDMAKELGFLGYVLAGTNQADAWKLLTGGATPTA